jgi:hypothetical protein
MPERIAEATIQHFKHLLTTEPDPKKRGDHHSAARRGRGQAAADQAAPGARARGNRLSRPLPPMRGIDLDPLLPGRIQPAAKDSTTREDERMHAVQVDHGELKITIEGRSRDGLPHAHNRCAP